jgi:hypothetical protein
MRSGDATAPARGRLRPSRARSLASGPGIRRIGLASAVLASAASVPLILAQGSGKTEEGLARTPPYAVPSAEGRTTDGRVWDPARHLPGGTALVYVSEQCPYCRAELSHWASLQGTDAAPLPWIVASPGSTVDTPRWVPRALRDRVVWDADGAIAASLGIQAVPATLWVDESGIVRLQRLGESSADAIGQEFRSLARSWDAAQRVRAQGQGEPDQGGRP